MGPGQTAGAAHSSSNPAKADGWRCPQQQQWGQGRRLAPALPPPVAVGVSDGDQTVDGHVGQQQADQAAAVEVGGQLGGREAVQVHMAARVVCGGDAAALAHQHVSLQSARGGGG